MRLVFLSLCLLWPVVNGDKDYCSNQGSPSRNSSDMKSNYEHIKFYTTRPGHSEKSETMVVSFDSGLHVAGQKVITESEHRRLVSELRDELQSALTLLNETRTALQESRIEHETDLQLQNNKLQPPTCRDPGGKELVYVGNRWLCSCNDNFFGESCEWLLIGHGGCRVGTSSNHGQYTFTEEPLHLEGCQAACLANPSCVAIEVNEHGGCEMHELAPTHAAGSSNPVHGLGCMVYTPCGEHWTAFGKHCYWFSDQATSWSGAQQICQALGAHLASIHSQGENDFILELLAPSASWLGGKSMTVEGEWLWTDGTSWDYSNWDSQTAGIAASLHGCVKLLSSGVWQKASCSAVSSELVCKK